jgi:MinD superfamily P-loop ATPase
VSAALKKLITSLRDILQGRSTTDPCHHCIRFCDYNALLLSADHRYTKPRCNVCLLTCAHVSWGWLFICLFFAVYLLDI